MQAAFSTTASSLQMQEVMVISGVLRHNPKPRDFSFAFPSHTESSSLSVILACQL